MLYFQSWISETVVADFQDDFLVDREVPVTRYESLAFHHVVPRKPSPCQLCSLNHNWRKGWESKMFLKENLFVYTHIFNATHSFSPTN